MLDELIFFMLMAVGVTYLDNGGPYASNYGCPAYCAVNHKHVAFKDTLVVISDMAKNNNKSMLGGFFNYLSGRLGTEIDSIPTPAPSFDNLKTMQKNVDDHAEMLLAKSAAVRDMENAGMDVDIIPNSDRVLSDYTAKPVNTKVDMLVNEASYDMNRDYPEDLYNAIMHAEHKGKIGKEGYNPWIRTRGTKGQREGTATGSNAFGPVQLLSSTFGRIPMTLEGRPMIDYTPEELEFLERYKQQGQEFYKHGANKGKVEEGYVYDPRFDYGGEGYGYNDEEKALYESAAKKLIAYEWKRANADLDTFIKRWRFGDKSPKGYEHDRDYYDIVRKHMNP